MASPELLGTGADQVIIGLQSFLTQEGVRSGEVFADTAYFFEDSTAYHLRDLVLTLFTETGQERARVTAEGGRLDNNTHELSARGNVVLTIIEGNKRVESSELNYDPNGDRIWSDSATVMHDGGTVLEGMGFSSDLEFRRYTVGPGSIRNIRSGGGGRS